MALSDNSINYISLKMRDAASALAAVRSMDMYINELNTNSNYRAFVSGTELGNSLNHSLLELRDIALAAGKDVEKLLDVTDEFLKTQAKLNKALDSETGSFNSAYDGAWDGLGTRTRIPGGTAIPSSATWIK